MIALATANRTQIGHKPNTKNIIKKFTELKGNAQKLLMLFYKICQKERSTIIEGISNDFINNYCGIAKGSIKTTIHRLIDLGILERINGDLGGPGRTRTLQLTDSIYKEMLHLDNNGKLYRWTQIGHKLGHKHGHKHGHKPYTKFVRVLNVALIDQILHLDVLMLLSCVP